MAAVVGRRSPWRYRRTFVAVEGLVALAGAAGAIQLALGRSTPPTSDLHALHLSHWTLPGVWLFATVAVPSACAAAAALRRSPRAPSAVMAASSLLALELVAQVPFVGFNALQAVFMAVAVAMAVLALRVRGTGWSPPRPEDRSTQVHDRPIATGTFVGGAPGHRADNSGSTGTGAGNGPKRT